MRLAFSSRIIVKRLRDRGIEIPTEQGALDALIGEGYTDIYVQPLHFTGGEEFDKLKHNILNHERHKNSYIADWQTMVILYGPRRTPE